MRDTGDGGVGESPRDDDCCERDCANSEDEQSPSPENEEDSICAEFEGKGEGQDGGDNDDKSREPEVRTGVEAGADEGETVSHPRSPFAGNRV